MAIVELRIAVEVEVDPAQGVLQLVERQHIPKALPSNGSKVIQAIGGVLSAHRDQLADEGLLDFGALGAVHGKLTVKSGSGYCWGLSPCSLIRTG